MVGVGSRPPGELFVVRPSHRRKMIAVARRTSPACHRLGTNNQVGSGVRRALGSDIGSSPNAKAQRTGSPRFKLSFPQLRGCGAFQLPQYPWVPQEAEAGQRSGSGTGPILLSQATFLLPHISNSGPVPLSSRLEEVKRAAAERWVAAVNADGSYGRWAYAMAKKTTEIGGIISMACASP